MAEIRVKDNESLDSALRRFKRPVSYTHLTLPTT